MYFWSLVDFWCVSRTLCYLWCGAACTAQIWGFRDVLLQILSCQIAFQIAGIIYNIASWSSQRYHLCITTGAVSPFSRKRAALKNYKHSYAANPLTVTVCSSGSFVYSFRPQTVVYCPNEKEKRFCLKKPWHIFKAFERSYMFIKIVFSFMAAW